jgi:predicted permease
LRTDFEDPLYVLMAAAALVLLIACANIANLLLARSAARRKEMTVRLALGAGRSRLMRQLLTESTLLSLLGGALGVAFANWGVRLLLAFLPAQRLPFVLEVHTDAHVLGFALAVSVLTGLLFGMAPAIQSSRTDLVESLKDEGACLRLAARRFELRNALVISQVALSLLLLVGAGLFLRSLQNTAAIRVGMDTENVLLASIDARLSGYTSTQAQDFFRRLEAQLREKPGVRAVGSSQTRLLSGYWDTISVSVPGRPKPGGQRQIFMNVIAGDFYRVAGIQILRGRDFGTRDTAAGSKVAIINETGARHFFGDSDPVGRTVKGGGRFGDIEIVGIASDSKYLSVREEMPRILYFTAEQIPQVAGQRTIYVRTAGDPTRYGEVVRGEVRALDRQLPVYNIRTFAGQKADSLAREHLIALLSGFFGALALLLAAIGLYGVMAYAVLRRTREIGIRLSLGAARSTVVWMVFRSALGMAGAGIGIGLPLSLWLSRLVTSQLYGVRPSDPATLATACIVLAGIAVLAASIPAWKASRVDPMVALRYE